MAETSTPVQPLEVQTENNQDSKVFESTVKTQLKAKGTSGTELYAGYFSEEYLQKLRGPRGAKIYDEIRRSESQVAMLMNAIMNPIKAGTWEFEAADVENGELHKQLMEHNAKEMIDWETHLHEALTFIIFGFSMFEMIDTVVINHPKFGTFNGLKALAFRSQKTIERWITDRETGQLQFVEQWAQGDLTAPGGPIVKMDANFLAIISLQKEGDNYEGISALRAMYGPWFRKNLYLKIAAIGLEKSAIGTPIGKVPSGKENSDDLEKFKDALANFTAHESAFITIPQGWEVEMIKSDFDASKVKDMIAFENSEMANAVVANFLMLGSNGGGGSFALGTDLSDFFLTGIQNYANLISGVWNRIITPSIIRKNYGPQAAYPKLKATGINDKAGKELAEILNSLAGKEFIKADDKLEDYLRKQYTLPGRDPATSRKVEEPKPFGMQFKERHLKLAETYNKQWDIDKEKVKSLMQKGLADIIEGYKKTIKNNWANLSPSARRNFALKLEPKGVENYAALLREELARIANTALIGAKKETPKANKKNIKLSESIQLAAPRGGYFDALPSAIKNIIKNQAGLISKTQAADINKIVTFQYMSSADSTDNPDQVILDIDSILVPVIEDGSKAAGMSVDAAAGNAVSTSVNQARLEWFFEPEVLNTIESFTFYNEDPVSEICQELDGTTWAAGDPDIDRFTPPLHHNCKSRLQVNEKGSEGNPEIQRNGTPVSESALKSVTLSECKCPYHVNVKLKE